MASHSSNHQRRPYFDPRIDAVDTMGRESVALLAESKVRSTSPQAHEENIRCTAIPPAFYTLCTMKNQKASREADFLSGASGTRLELFARPEYTYPDLV